MAQTINLILNAAATGTVDAIVVTYSPAITSLVNNRIYAFVSSGANTSATPTVNINTLGAKTIKKQGNQALVAGDIPAAGAQMFISYRSSGDYFELVNPTSVFGTGVGQYTQGNDSRLSDARNRKMLAYQNTNSSHTGDTNETSLCNLLIPANTMGANDQLMVMSLIRKVGGTVGNAVFNMYLSPTSNNFSVGTLIGFTQLNVTAITNRFQRTVTNKNSQTTNQVVPVSVSQGGETTVQTVAATNVNVDFTVDQYLIITGDLTVITETATLGEVQLFINKA